MAEYTVVAFKWTGTGYNATYNSSHTATLTDNDSAYEGAGDTDETVSIDGGTATATTGAPYAIKVAFTDTDGDAHVETFNFFNSGGNWYFTPSENSNFSEGAELGQYQSHTNGWDYSTIACFAGGTLIETENGPTPIEDLSAGDQIRVFGGGFSTLRLNLSQKIKKGAMLTNPKLRPVKIVQDALGPGFPNQDLRVSRQHRMLVSSPISKRMFGQTNALISAIRLTEFPGCFVDEDAVGISYFHLIFDRHEIVFANGTPAESFYPGSEAMKAMPCSAKQEFVELFPDLKFGAIQPSHACFVPSTRLQKKLVARHVQNSKSLINCDPFIAGRPKSVPRQGFWN